MGCGVWGYRLGLLVAAGNAIEAAPITRGPCACYVFVATGVSVPVLNLADWPVSATVTSPEVICATTGS
jgi:hypothetical protein